MSPVDLVGTEQAAAALVRYRSDFHVFAAEQLKIAGQPFRLWPCQTPLLEVVERQLKQQGFVRMVCLKARQTGSSTLVQALAAWRVMLWPNVNAIVIADHAKRSETLFDICRGFHEQLDELIRPAGRYVSKRELYFANPSPVTRFSDPGLRSRITIDSAHKEHIAIGSEWKFVHLCLGGENFVWSASRGFVRLSDLMVGDQVVVDFGESASVSAISRRPSDSRPWVRVVMWGARGAPLVCTADHKVLTTGGWVEAGNLTSKDEVVLPIRPLTPSRPAIDFRPFLVRPTKEKLDSWRHGPAEFPLNREAGWVLGLFVAEGYLKWAGTRRVSGICFALHHDEAKWVPKIEEVLRPWAKSVSTDVRENHRLVVSVYSRALASAFLEWCYLSGDVYRSHTKKFPEWVWEAPREFLEGMVAGYFSGDGSKRTSSKFVAASTTSPVLAGQVRDLLLSLRVGWPSLWWRAAAQRKRYKNTERSNRESWTLGLSGRAAMMMYQWRGESLEGFHARKAQHWKMGWREVHVRVCKVESIPAPPEMFDVEVKHERHSYRVGGCVVANSEAARFKNPAFVFDGVLPAVHRVPGTFVIIESSAEMAGHWYRDFCNAAMKGQNGFEFVFVPWFLHPEYYRCFVCRQDGIRCTSSAHRELTAEPKVLKKIGLSGEERHLMAEFGLSPGHILWMREKLLEMGNDWDLFRQSYPLTPDDAWVTPGTQVFPMAQLRDQHANVQDPKRHAEVFPGPRVMDTPQGRLRIWEEPESGKTYDIGADVSMGLGKDENSNAEDEVHDFSVACVLERGSNKQVAEWVSRAIDSHELAVVLYWLGMYYNTAQLAVETNGIGGATSSQLSKLGYVNLYTWRFRDELSPRYSKKVGWECVVPESKILSVDLRWVSAKDINVGDSIIGCMAVVPSGRGRSNSFRIQRVTDRKVFTAPLVEVTLDNGQKTCVSRTHPFWVFRKYGRWQWIMAESIVPGDVVKCLSVWETLRTYDAGRLSAFLDGEGHLSQGKSKGLHLFITQAEGALAQEICELWSILGFDWIFKWLRHKRRPQEKPCMVSGVARTKDVLHALGSLRPTRLLRVFQDRIDIERLTLNGIPNVVVTKVQPRGRGEVIGLTTSPDHTLIADGIVGHNTNQRSKAWLVSFAVHELTNNRVIIRSEILLKEMQNFVRKGEREWGAVAGRHDDATMAWMIALLTSDDENFERYFGLRKALEGRTRDGVQEVVQAARKPEPWECDMTFLKKPKVSLVDPWE